MENVNIFGIKLNYINFGKIKLITKITHIYTSNYKQDHKFKSAKFIYFLFN